MLSQAPALGDISHLEAVLSRSKLCEAVAFFGRSWVFKTWPRQMCPQHCSVTWLNLDVWLRMTRSYSE